MDDGSHRTDEMKPGVSNGFQKAVASSVFRNTVLLFFIVPAFYGE